MKKYHSTISLDVAAMVGECDWIQQALDAGFNINTQDNSENGKNRTALIRAAVYGHYNAVVFLLERRANPHIQDIAGDNALTLTMRNIDNKNSNNRQGRLDSIALLRKKGVKMDPKIQRHQEALIYFEEHTTPEEFRLYFSEVTIEKHEQQDKPEEQKTASTDKESSWSEYLTKCLPALSTFLGVNNKEAKNSQEMQLVKKYK
jgi:ankyrin repeat protein